MQSIFLPAIAGQNHGAGRFDRVRATFRVAALTLLCQLDAELVRVFTPDPAVVAVAAGYLRIVS